jgi:acyl carrier protein
MALSKELLLNFIANNFGVDGTDVHEDTPLFSGGMIDSADMVQLIEYVESEGNVEFTPDDLTLDNLDSIGRILRFVADRQAQ